MKTLRILNAGLLAVGCAVIVTVSLAGTGGEQTTGQAVSIDADDIGGVVTGPKGPEAGVWVIAETTDLPTKFVEDRRHRRSRPLPAARSAEGELQRVGARLRPRRLAEGAGDAGQDAEPDGGRRAERARRRRVLPGRLLVLAAQACPRRASSPAPGRRGNGISPNIDRPGASGSASLKSGGCTACHQLGTKGTREIPPALGTFHDVGRGVGAAHAVRTGRRADDQRRSTSSGASARSRCSPTGPIASPAGEVPPAPPRPQGIERNVVITEWDWADPKAYLHDEVSTDRRNPTLNANGLIYGALELSADYLPVLDPVRQHDQPGAADRARSEHAADAARRCRSRRRTGASEAIWTSKNNVHNPMFDEKGRVWITSAVRPSGQSGLLQGGLEPSVGEALPARSASAGISRCTTRRRRSSRTSAPASARTT